MRNEQTRSAKVQAGDHQDAARKKGEALSHRSREWKEYGVRKRLIIHSVNKRQC